MHRALVLTALFSASLAAQAVPTVTVDSGTLIGIDQGDVVSYRGVPYAKPPVGDLRWAPPQKPTPWRGARHATDFALPCAQPTNPDGKTPNGGGVRGETSEDCLYLNVTAPADAENAPVMVWLHGGASFLGGGHLGSYNAPAFAEDGVIVVSINYRLGPLSYFAHPAVLKAARKDEPVANYALMDAIAALKWVQRNIEDFGGDPNQVTVFGQSAGGYMVLSLLGMPAAEGLFQKAGIQSGARLRTPQTLEEAKQAASEWASKMGLDGENATLDELRSIPVDKFANDRETARSLGSPIDGRLKVKSAQQAFADGSANYVPLIIGTNNGEGGFHGARDVANAMSEEAPVFLYQFAYVPEWRKEAQSKGAPHSAEIVYVFDSWDETSLPASNVKPVDREVAKRVHSCWVAFAKADTDARFLNCAGGYNWPAYTVKNDRMTRFEEHPLPAKASELPDGPPPGSPRGSMAPN